MTLPSESLHRAHAARCIALVAIGIVGLIAQHRCVACDIADCGDDTTRQIH